MFISVVSKHIWNGKLPIKLKFGPQMLKWSFFATLPEAQNIKSVQNKLIIIGNIYNYGFDVMFLAQFCNFQGESSISHQIPLSRIYSLIRCFIETPFIYIYVNFATKTNKMIFLIDVTTSSALPCIHEK